MCWVLVGCITGRLSEKTYEWRMRSRFRWFLMPGPLAKKATWIRFQRLMAWVSLPLLIFIYVFAVIMIVFGPEPPP